MSNRLAGFVPRLPYRNDFAGGAFFAGQGSGLVTVSGVNSAKKIILFDRLTNLVVAVTRSKADGTWSLNFLNANRKYYIAAFDDQGQFNAVIRDNITPAPMP